MNTAALLLCGAGPVSAAIGLSTPGLARVVGALLALYAGALLWNADRPRVGRAATRVAVVRAICDASDPEAAARALRSAVDAATIPRAVPR